MRQRDAPRSDQAGFREGTHGGARHRRSAIGNRQSAIASVRSPSKCSASRWRVPHAVLTERLSDAASGRAPDQPSCGRAPHHATTPPAHRHRAVRTAGTRTSAGRRQAVATAAAQPTVIDARTVDARMLDQCLFHYGCQLPAIQLHARRRRLPAPDDRSLIAVLGEFSTVVRKQQCSDKAACRCPCSFEVSSIRRLPPAGQGRAKTGLADVAQRRG